MEQRTQDTKITSVLEENFMPYAMSVIVSRSIPEIDGLKPAHRKLLYTISCFYFSFSLLRLDVGFGVMGRR